MIELVVWKIKAPWWHRRWYARYISDIKPSRGFTRKGTVRMAFRAAMWRH